MREIEYCIVHFVDSEYIAFYWQDGIVNEIEKSNSLIEILGKLGKKGWELVVSDLISISKIYSTDEMFVSTLFILKRITREHVTAYR